VDLTGGANLPASASLIAVPGGRAGVARTLELMCSLVNQYKTDLNVRTLAVELVQSCAPKDRRCELSALQHFVRDQIRYVADIESVETLQTPVQTLKLQAGDCDDKATLLNALAAAIGMATRFCAIGVRGGPFSHVMSQVALGRGWINCETIVPGVEIGWFPPDATQGMLAHC
jgi:transglutaminase-like putative cysteine protease